MSLADPVARAEYNAAYRSARREELNERERQRRANFPDRVKQQRRSYQPRATDWRRRNPNTPARNMAAQGRRQCRKYGLPVESVHWTAYQRIALLPCFDCGQEPSGGVDHRIPFCQGGRNVIENLQPACRTCNVRKGGSERRDD